jgi:thiol:disulfide interchange protein DsbG
MPSFRPLLALVALAAVAACSKTEPPAPPAPAAPPAVAAPAPAPAASAAEAQQAYASASAGSGFSVGPTIGADPVLVFFDPQCPHCAELWKAAQPLLGKVRMVWMPVGFVRANSAPQGALILAAKDPAATMTEHEALLANRQGGLPVPAEVPADVLAKVKANTELLGKLGADSVPFIVYKNRQTGAYGSHAGTLPTEALAQLVGI